MLAKKVLYHLNHAPIPYFNNWGFFVVVLFCFWQLSQTSILLILSAFQVARITGMAPAPGISFEW
jgi:hypothetical protein